MLATWIIGGLLAVCFLWVVVRGIRGRKRGKTGCRGCDAECPMKGGPEPHA